LHCYLAEGKSASICYKEATPSHVLAILILFDGFGYGLGRIILILYFDSNILNNYPTSSQWAFLRAPFNYFLDEEDDVYTQFI